MKKPLWTIINRRNKQDETGFNEGCYRYVDDYFFFYNNQDVLEVANESFARHLNEYKLSISKEKTEDFLDLSSLLFQEQNLQ